MQNFRETVLPLPDLFLLGIDAAQPFRLISQIQGRQPVEFHCLGDISPHEPRLRQVVIVPAVRRMKSHRPFQYPDGLLRFVVEDEKTGLLGKLQGSDAARIDIFARLCLVFSFGNRFPGKLGGRDRRAPGNGQVQ